MTSTPMHHPDDEARPHPEDQGEETPSHDDGDLVDEETKQLSREGWMHANLDRAVVNPSIAGTVRVQDEAKQAETGRLITTDAILECKTASSYIADQWGPSQEDEIVKGAVVS